jgi:hypothetical protein
VDLIQGRVLSRILVELKEEYTCSDPNIYLSISGLVKGLIWTLGH